MGKAVSLDTKNEQGGWSNDLGWGNVVSRIAYSSILMLLKQTQRYTFV